LAATIQENVDIQAFTLYNMGFKNYQKLNNLDFIWNPAFRCIPDNKNYGKYLFLIQEMPLQSGLVIYM
jgi:hypothetical protein